MEFLRKLGQIAAIVLVIVVIVLLADKCGTAAHAAEPLGQTDTRLYVQKLLFRDGAIPKKDKRRDLVDEITAAIDKHAEHYGIDQAIVAAVIYAESGFFHNIPGKSNQEVGLMQVHGRAFRLCKIAGLDLSEPDDQIACGTRWLRKVTEWCGQGLVADKEKCVASKGENTRACAGGMAAYLTGSCARPTKRVAWKVQRRLRLADWAKTTN